MLLPPSGHVKVWLKVISRSSCLKCVSIASNLVKVSKIPFITAGFTPPVTRNYVPTTVFAVNKPCWCIFSILCQAQVIVKTNCGLHCFLHQSNIRSYCPSEYSLLCYQYPKRIFNCLPCSWKPVIINSLTLVKVFARIWLHEPGLKWENIISNNDNGEIFGSMEGRARDVVRMLDQTSS